MTIAAVIAGRTGPVVTVAPDALVTDVVALLAEKHIGAVPVMDGHEVLGILSERDVLICLAKEGGAVLARQAREIMTAPAVTVAPSMAVLGALGLMTRRRIRHLPVVDGDRMVGFVSIGDLVKRRIDQIEAEAVALREYIRSA